MNGTDQAIDRVAVIGAGTMGGQIAQAIALAGLPVTLFDRSEHQVERAQQINQRLLDRQVEKGIINLSSATSALERVRIANSLEDAVTGVDLVIEAVVEEVELKRAVFQNLERYAPADAILASNSSTITISEITSDMSTRARTLALHFFNPALKMRLVEIAPAPYTTEVHVRATDAFIRAIDKEPVLLKREITGLLVNRVLWALRREAMWLADHGYADPADIDKAIKLGLNHPMGPFELVDFNGLDVALLAQQHRFQRSGDELDRPSKMLEELVENGHLGRKSGRGFYDYDANSRKSPAGV